MPPVLRQGLFFCLIFVGTGVSTPYAPVWLASVGLGAPTIGLIIALPMILRPFVAPPLALWADGFLLRRTPIGLLGLAAAVCYGLMLVVKGALLWGLFWFIAATAISSASPLTDVLTLRRAEKEGFDYAAARGVGSAGYVGGNVVGGMALAAFGAAVSLVWSSVLALGVGLGARLILPAEPVGEAGEAFPLAERLSGSLALLRDPAVLLLILACSLIQGSHALYYTFSAIDWTRHGVPAGLVGVLWGVSVGAEVMFFWFGGPFRRRLGGAGLVMLGGIGAFARWTAYALSPPLWMLFGLQCLHALTFTSTFTGSLVLIERFAPRRDASLAQVLLASLSFGTATGLATLASGWLYARFQVGGYWVMAAMAAFGVAAAMVLARRAHGGRAEI